MLHNMSQDYFFYIFFESTAPAGHRAELLSHLSLSLGSCHVSRGPRDVIVTATGDVNLIKTPRRLSRRGVIRSSVHLPGTGPQTAPLANRNQEKRNPSRSLKHLNSKHSAGPPCGLWSSLIMECGDIYAQGMCAPTSHLSRDESGALLQSSDTMNSCNN